MTMKNVNLTNKVLKTMTKKSTEYGSTMTVNAVKSLQQDQNIREEDDLDTSTESQSKSFDKFYELGDVLGEGGYGKVHQCFLKTTDGTSAREPYAVKTVPKEKYDSNELQTLDILSGCPHIVAYKDVFHEPEHSYIVMEEMQGGDLLDKLTEKTVYSEEQAKILFKTLLTTVTFCHDRGIAHCDIKPENILLKNKDDDTTIQLADFGLATVFRYEDGSFEPITEARGSIEYAAPEVFTRDEDECYDERCDIWSCGVVLYVLLCGYAPFEASDGCHPDDTVDEVLDQICQGSYEFHSEFWNEISPDAQYLVSSMLQVDPDQRCTLEEALNSCWMQ